jgi:ComF family protein
MAFQGGGEKQEVQRGPISLARDTLTLGFGGLFGGLADLLFPARCLGCGTEVDMQGRLCGPCWGDVTFIDGPVCACCGSPFEVDLGPETLCAGCLADPPQFDAARAMCRYDDGSRRFILGLKHGDRVDAARPLALWLTRAAAPFLDDVDVIAPVPLHRWRLLRRRFNQAAELARALRLETGRPVAADLLHRVRATQSQGGLNRSGRARNVKGAFRVNPRHVQDIRGCTVLLVDDVLTTGATVNACAKALKQAGAAAVHVVTLARVV